MKFVSTGSTNIDRRAVEIQAVEPGVHGPIQQALHEGRDLVRFLPLCREGLEEMRLFPGIHRVIKQKLHRGSYLAAVEILFCFDVFDQGVHGWVRFV